MIEKNKSEFFELLCLNRSDELKNWLISHGKSGKPVCPIAVVPQDEIDRIVKENMENATKNWFHKKTNAWL